MEPENSQSYSLESARVSYFCPYESSTTLHTIFHDDQFYYRPFPRTLAQNNTLLPGRPDQIRYEFSSFVRIPPAVPTYPLICYSVLCRVQIMKHLGVCHVVQPAFIYGLLGLSISIKTPFLTLSVGVLPMKIKGFRNFGNSALGLWNRI